jgi:hypothetical protein
MTVQIREAGGKAGKLTGATQEITLITPGWGSSGYYSAEVLEQAAKDRVFPRKTQQHIDHNQEDGVGSVATLAAYLNEDARWEPDWVDPDTGGKGRLVAENRVASKWRADLADLHEALGTSISAPAEISMGEAEGRQGRIIEKLLPGPLNRVDYVTVAGRGGRISEVLEAHKVEEARNVGQWLEARMHSMFTSISDDFYGEGKLTREERITLSAALGQALTSFVATVEAEAPQLFERDLWEDPTPASKEAAAPPSSPSDPAGVIKGEESLVTTIQIEESVHADLVAKSSRTTALEAELKEANEKLAAAEQATVTAKAEAIVAEAFGDLEAKVTRRSLVKAALSAETFDAEALKADAEEAAAELRVANGAGTVRGVGESAPADKKEMTAETAREQILANSGYTPKGAK